VIPSSKSDGFVITGKDGSANLSLIAMPPSQPTKKAGITPLAGFSGKKANV